MSKHRPGWQGGPMQPPPPLVPPSHTNSCPESAGQEALRACQDLQHMIDINSDHLERLRTTMANSASALTKQEIRTLEGKLIKHFSKQLATKASLPPDQFAAVERGISVYPSLAQWLAVVGVSSDSADVIMSKVGSVESLKDKSEAEVQRMVPPCGSQRQDLRRLTKALQHLKKYTDALMQKGGDAAACVDPKAPLELYWDSWTRDSDAETPRKSSASPPQSAAPIKPGTSRKHTPPSSQKGHFVSLNGPIVHGDCSDEPSVPTFNTPPISSSSMVTKVKTITTTAARPSVESRPGSAKIKTDSPPVPKSPKSPPVFPMEPDGPVQHSGGHLQVPVPKSPAPSMGHVIKHRFKKTLAPGKCDLCLDYFISGLKCKECKYKCHKECEGKVPPSCGLPLEFIDYFKQYVQHGQTGAAAAAAAGHSPRLPHSPGGGSAGSSSAGSDPPPSRFKPDHHHHHHHAPGAGGGSGSSMLRNPAGGGGGQGAPGPIAYVTTGSSSTTSSCTSSTPSTPLGVNATPPNSAAAYRGGGGGGGGGVGGPGTNFPFPEPKVAQLMAAHTLPLADPSQQLSQQQQQISPVAAPPKVQSPLIDSIKSYDSDKTLSGSSGSVGTAVGRSDSQDSKVSYDDSMPWHHQRHHSVSYREWDIPYEDINIGGKIGSGRFSTVHKGSWHGDVAVKLLHMENAGDEATLDAFRKEVATFRKTRHENLILFMGQSRCSDPPRLAIVTSLCKGNTLYTTLHLRRDKFSMNKIVIIAQQITNGMGYLHDKGIVHKDLKSKNVFLENGRAIITDFGLVNVARRLCGGKTAAKTASKDSTFSFEDQQNRQQGNSLPNEAYSRWIRDRMSMSIPKGWLCYLAPEIMQNLRVQSSNSTEDLPFTKASDVYAFGTIWFELLTGEWPWKQQPPETVIWSVGRGMRPSLANLQASRDVKDILVLCWKFQLQDRPDFTSLNQSLEKIPKKRLARSPSHPVHLSRSAEAVF